MERQQYRQDGKRGRSNLLLPSNTSQQKKHVEKRGQIKLKGSLAVQLITHDKWSVITARWGQEGTFHETSQH